MTRTLPLLALLLLAGCAAERPPLTGPTAASVPAANWSQATPVNVTLANFAFQPDHLAFERGHPYRLHLENHGSGGHNFDASAFFRTVAFEDGAASDKVRAAGGVIELAAGKSFDVDFVPTTAGTYPLECSHPFHASFGMTGEITVR